MLVLIIIVAIKKIIHYIAQNAILLKNENYDFLYLLNQNACANMDGMTLVMNNVKFVIIHGKKKHN